MTDQTKRFRWRDAHLSAAAASQVHHSLMQTMMTNIDITCMVHGHKLRLVVIDALALLSA